MSHDRCWRSTAHEWRDLACFRRGQMGLKLRPTSANGLKRKHNDRRATLQGWACPRRRSALCLVHGPFGMLSSCQDGALAVHMACKLSLDAVIGHRVAPHSIAHVSDCQGWQQLILIADVATRPTACNRQSRRRLSMRNATKKLKPAHARCSTRRPSILLTNAGRRICLTHRCLTAASCS